MERAAEGESKGTGERRGVGGGREEKRGSGRDRPPGFDEGRMSDETNRAVQAPTHAATAVIYGGGVENRRVSGRWGRDPQKIRLRR